MQYPPNKGGSPALAFSLGATGHTDPADASPSAVSSPVAIDFETYYARDFDISSLGLHPYCADPRFDAYLVAVYSPDLQWVGHPLDCPWASLHRRPLIAHNAAFESAVFARLQADRIIPPGITPALWIDTADLASYLQAPRSLAAAASLLLGRTLDKSIRTSLRS